MTLKEYANHIGPRALAREIGVSHSAIYQWVSLEKCPGPKAAWKLVAFSNGLLSLNEIYAPFMVKHFKKGSPQHTLAQKVLSA